MPAVAETVSEDFQAYPIQSDTTGVFHPDDGDTTFRITTTGNTGASDPIVAGVGEAQAASAGIAEEETNRFWILGSSAGQTSFDGFLLIGDIPGIHGEPGALPVGGPIGEFFLGSQPRDLTGGVISAKVRETTMAAASKVRFLLTNADDNEVVTAQKPLTAAFQTVTVPTTAFTIPLQPVGEGTFDITRVVNLGFEFFTALGTAPALSFNVDDIQIDAPNDADSDNDGLTDNAEVTVHGTDPNNPDTDGDGTNDGDEVAAARDPTVNEAAAILPILKILLNNGP